MERMLQKCQERVKETGQEAETHGSEKNPKRSLSWLVPRTVAFDTMQSDS
jgi:hypothetical protein